MPHATQPESFEVLAMRLQLLRHQSAVAYDRAATCWKAYHSTLEQEYKYDAQYHESVGYDINREAEKIEDRLERGDYVGIDPDDQWTYLELEVAGQGVLF